MSTEKDTAIPFTLLNVGKRFQSTDLRLLPLFPLGAQEPRLREQLPPSFPAGADQDPNLLDQLLPRFPAGAQEPTLLELLSPRFPAGAQEPTLLELLPPQFPAGAQEPRLLQLFPVRKGIEANDGILGSHPVAGTSEPELPNLLAKHLSQPLASSALAQRSGNSLASDGRVQDMVNKLTAGNKTEGRLSRSTNSFSTQAEHRISCAPALENVTTIFVAAICAPSPHPTREVNSDRDTANQSGIASTRRELAETRPVQEPMPTMATHVGRTNPERADSTSISLQASYECVSAGQLAIQDPFAPESSMSTTLAVGGQAVNVRLPIEVDTVRGNATNPTKLAPASGPLSTGGIDTSLAETNQSGISICSGRISKKRPLAIQEPISTRVEHVGSRRLQKADLGNKSTPESREHVSQRLPLSNVPIKKRRLSLQEPSLSRQGSTRPGGKTVKRKPLAIRPAIQELLPSGQGSTRGGRKVLPLASREPTQEHGNPIPLTRGESGGKSVLQLLPVEMTTFVGQHTQNTRSPARRKAIPRGWPTDPRRSTGGEATSVRPLQNRRHPVRVEGGPRTKSSAYKGVTRYKRTERWEANIWHDRKQTYIGAHATEIQAARAYDRALIHFRGEEAPLNFSLDDYRAEFTQLSNVRSEDLVLILRKQSRGPGKPMPDYTYRRRT